MAAKKKKSTTTPARGSASVQTRKPRSSSATSRKTTSSRGLSSNLMSGELIFTKENYLWIGIGLLVMATGFILMLGGAMPSPDVWEPERIYSFRRITLAPIVILIGLAIQVYAIFKQ